MDDPPQLLYWVTEHFDQNGPFLRFEGRDETQTDLYYGRGMFVVAIKEATADGRWQFTSCLHPRHEAGSAAARSYRVAS